MTDSIDRQQGARSFACDAALRANDLDPTLWRKGFVRRCEKALAAKGKDPVMDPDETKD